MFRSPYWNHRLVVDWTGMVHNFSFPMMRALFVPIQLLDGRLRRIKSCCEPSYAACRGTERACFVDVTSRPSVSVPTAQTDCCATKLSRRRPSPRSMALRSLRQRLSVPWTAVDVALEAAVA